MKFEFEVSLYGYAFTNNSVLCLEVAWTRLALSTHALLHMAFGSEYESPRLGWCWMGEDYMRATRVLISSCMKETSLEDVSRKSAAKFLRAMDSANRDD